MDDGIEIDKLEGVVTVDRVSASDEAAVSSFWSTSKRSEVSGAVIMVELSRRTPIRVRVDVRFKLRRVFIGLSNEAVSF